VKITNFDPSLAQALGTSVVLSSPASGDVSGPLPGELTVVAIQGTPVGSTPGSVGDVLTLVAGTPITAEWEPPAVGTTPGGELGGTWASPTVDATHSGSAHLALGSTSSTAAPGDHAHSGSSTAGPLVVVVDGGGGAITGNPFVDLLLTEAGEFTNWTILAHPTGDIEFDVLVDPFADFPPTSSIVGAAPPTLTGDDHVTDSTAGWTTTYDSGDVVRVRVTSVSNLLRATLVIERI
jgi:hypothetical protein